MCITYAIEVQCIVGCIVMTLLLILVILIASKYVCDDVETTQPGNSRLMSIKEFPFMAAIVVKKHGMVSEDSLQCGATIISANWVLTAAHCLTLLDEQGFDKDVVYINSASSTWTRGKQHDILTWTYHEKFDQNVMNNDIALIQVKQPFQGAFSYPIPIASIQYRYRPNQAITVIGWGLHPSGTRGSLREVEIFIFNQRHCEDLYRILAEKVTKTMFCAGVKEEGEDPCEFDSGGPIFDHNLLIGIMSWGVDCWKRNQPGVYTRTNLYKSWIISKMNQSNDPNGAIFKKTP